MSRAPAFQLYASDFMADPLVDAMTPEELGGYFRLLLVAWQQEAPGHLPGDEALLAAWSRLRDRWAACRTAILRCFRETKDGRIYQKRMVHVAAEQAVYREKQRQKGLASAAARERNRGSTAVQPEDDHGSVLVDTRFQPEPNPLSPSPPPPKTKRSKRYPDATSSRQDEFDFLAVYTLYPRKEGRKKGLLRCRSQIKKQEKYDALLQAVKNYAATVTDPQYAKHFDTFMGCWEDYIDAGLLTPRSPPRLPQSGGKPYTGPRPPMAALAESEGGKQKL